MKQERFPQGIDIRPARPVDDLLKDARRAFDADVGEVSNRGFVLFEKSGSERPNPYEVYFELNFADALGLMCIVGHREEDLRGAAARAPDNPSRAVALNNLGCFLFHWRRYEQANDCLSEAAALDDSNDVPAHNRDYCRAVMKAEQPDTIAQLKIA